MRHLVTGFLVAGPPSIHASMHGHAHAMFQAYTPGHSHACTCAHHHGMIPKTSRVMLGYQSVLSHGSLPACQLD